MKIEIEVPDGEYCNDAEGFSDCPCLANGECQLLATYLRFHVYPHFIYLYKDPGCPSLKKAEPEKTLIQLYEERIGMMTPMILEEMRRVEVMYQRDWIEAAIDEAVKAGAHSVRYVSQVLAAWKTKGYKAKRGEEKAEAHKGTVKGGVMDPARFKGQKYDNVVRR